MRWLKALLAGWALILSGAAASFDFNSSYYAVYEGPLDGYGCRNVYIVPQYSLLIIASDTPTPIRFMPQTTGFKMSYCGSSIPLAGFTKVSMTANDMAALGATLSSYKLFSGDFNGDGKLDFFLQGDATVRNSMILTDNGAGTPQAFYNFYGTLDGAQYPNVVVLDVDQDGRSDIVATDANGNTTTAFANTYNGFNVSNTGTGGNTFNVNLAGSIDGKFRVDESGAAIYSVDIFAAPGTAGVQPHVSLNYSSSNGDGIAGLGWSIAGVSSIERCRQTPAQDGNSAAITLGPDDRFCLDGQRLILTSGIYGAEGSTYRTEIDTYAEITVLNSGSAAAGNPNGFKVVRKDGSVSYYGAYFGGVGADSRHTVLAGTKTLSWSIAHFADSVGNGIRFSYINNEFGNQHLISRIDYAYGSDPGTTASSNTYLQFVYEDRPDASRVYVGGALMGRLQRLVAIRSVNGGVEVRRYSLVYRTPDTVHPRSLVEKLFECVGSNCLSPTTFNWQLDSGGGYGTGTLVATVGGTNRASVRPLDINDDGKMDLVLQAASSRNVDPDNTQSLIETDFTLYTQLSNGVTLAAPQALFTGTYPTLSNTLTGNAPLIVFDYNNDGRMDLMAQSKNGGGYFIGTAAGLVAGGGTATMPYNGGAASDYTGDGIADAVNTGFYQIMLYTANRVNLNGQWAIQYADPQFGVLSGWSPPPPGTNCMHGTSVMPALVGAAADADGDGRADFPTVNQYTACDGNINGLPSAGFAWSRGGVNFSLSPWVPGAPVGVVDMNGDGLADLWVEEEGSVTMRKLYFSTGTGFSDPVVVGDKTTLEMASFIDYNGDGNLDLLYPSGDHLAVRLFQPATMNFGAEMVVSAGGAPIPYVAGAYLKSDTYNYADVDGDGRQDVVRVHYLGNASSEIWVYRSGVAGPAGNRIVGIDNGLGRNTSVTYKPLNDSSVYTKSYDASDAAKWPGLPVFDMISPTYVVSQVGVTAPAAHATVPGAVNNSAVSSIAYQYSGLKVQSGGRGTLGFASIKTTDNQTGIKTATYYRQDFPFIGSPFWIITQTAGGVITQFDAIYYASTTRAGVGTSYYQVYESKTERTVNDPVTAAETAFTVKQNGAPDEWGNFPSVTTSVYPAGAHTDYLTQKVATYNYNSADDKRFGRLGGSIVTHKRGSESNIRVTTFTYYPTGSNLAGLLWTERLTAIAGGPYKTTSYEYDVFGNKTLVTESATGETDRYARAAYDASGRFVASRSGQFYTGSGAWGEQVEESVVARNEYGQPTEVQGLNGVVTFFDYDVLGREISRSNNAGSAVTTQYLRGGLVGAQLQVKTTAATGATAAEFFDAAGRSMAKGRVGFDGRWVYSETEYDSAGRVKRTSNPHYSGDPVYWTVNNYDSFRLLSQVAPVTGGGTTTVASYNYNGLTTVITNAAGQTRTELRNAAGEVAEITDNLGGKVLYTYTPAGDVRKTDTTGTQSGGAVATSTVLTYDGQGRKIRMLDSDKGVWFYEYNGFGEVINQYKVMSADTPATLATAIANSVPMQRTKMTYDRRRRLVERTDYREGGAVEAVARWEYDTADNGLGQLATDSVDDHVIGHVYGYDNYGRLTAMVNANDAWYVEETTYDEYGRVATQADATPSGQGTRSNYNAYGYLRSVQDLTTDTVVYLVQGMDALGHVTSASIGNGATTTWNYDQGTGLLVNQYAALGSSTLQNLTYTWDALGNQTTRRDQGLLPSAGVKNIQQTFCYDGLNRLIKTHQGTLTGSCSIAVADQDQEYDSLGSIMRKTGVGTYAYNSGHPHQLQSTSDGVSYSYDAVGNMTADSSGRTLAYSVFDKPTSIAKGAEQTSFGYGLDRELLKRVDREGAATSTTYFIGDVEKIVKPDGSYDMRRNIAGVAIWTHHFTSSDVETGVDKQYVYKDVLGSVVMITNAAGVSTQQFAYDAWGRRVWINNGSTYLAAAPFLPVSAQRTTEGFTGHEMLDGVGLIHMQGRIYDQRLGRFVQADPVVQAPDMMQSYNRYAYVLNAPLQFTDPTGFEVGIYDPTPYFNKPIEGVTSCGDGCSPVSPTGPLQMPLNLSSGTVSIGSFNVSISFSASAVLSGASIWSIASSAESAQGGKSAKRDGQKSRMTGKASQGGGGETTAQENAEKKNDPEDVIVECCTKPEARESGVGSHHYEISAVLCDDCSPNDAFDAVRYFSAPGAPYAVDGTHILILSGGNPIRQTVDPKAMTIKNVALPGHVFGGMVVISIVKSNGVVSAHIEGSGIGPNARLNQILGPVIFQALGYDAYLSLHANTMNMGP